MNVKRGILASLALYFTTMIVGILLTVISKVNLSLPENIPTAYWVITIITTVLLACFASLWYFSEAKRNTKEGFKLGAMFVGVGFVLDALFFLISQENALQIMKEYYTNFSFYIVIALVVASAVFIGARYNLNHTVKETSKAKIAENKSKKSKTTR